MGVRVRVCVKHMAIAMDVFLCRVKEFTCSVWLGTGEFGDLTKLQDISGMLQCSEDDDDDDDNVGGVRSHDNRNYIARLQVSIHIYCHLRTL